jgi:predicted alpha/beta-hydrolase family hydrolase
MNPPPSSPAASAGALLLTPGAGSSASHSSLVALEEALAPLPVARVDFPYRREGRKAPDRAPKLIACIREEAAALAARTGVAPEHLVLGGRSMGGRMCSMAVAEGLPAAGLVLISYPLHPPGRPEQLRVAHFPQLHVPCLFVSGERDTFATREELEHHVAAIPGRVTTVWVPKAGHDLKRHDATIVAAVQEWLAAERLVVR